MKKITLSAVLGLLSISGLLAQTVVTFNFTGAVQTYTVPAFVTQITVDCKGAQGGANGGLGGRVQCILPVSPGDVLSIFVGGTGGAYITNSAGGYNGGGTAGTATVQQYAGAGGGGASDICINGTAFTDRYVVAGGGGGNHPNNGPGGLGGGLIGGAVTNNGNTCMSTWAMGGTQSAGGAPSVWSGTCCSFTAVPGGSLGIGGNGSGPGVNCNNGDAGSGGGGGYYGGGGGGTYTAGGGGSSYTDSSCTAVIHTQGFQSGDGQVIISHSPVSVEEFTALQQVVIFPNPATDHLSISFPQNLSSANISLMDIQGRVVYTELVGDITKGAVHHFDVSSVAQGIYSLKISSEGHSVIRKITISR